MVFWWRCRHCGTEKTADYLEKSLLSEKGTAWANFSSHGHNWTVLFFEDEGVVAINIVRYLNILERKFNQALRRRGIDTRQMWFQQDGATPHTTTSVVDWLQKTFRTNTRQSPLEFYLWWYKLSAKLWKNYRWTSGGTSNRNMSCCN